MRRMATGPAADTRPFPGCIPLCIKALLQDVVFK